MALLIEVEQGNEFRQHCTMSSTSAERKPCRKERPV